MKKAQKRRGKKKQGRGAEKAQGMGAKDVRVRFARFVRGSGGQIDKETHRGKGRKRKKEKVRKSSRRNGQRMKHNVKLSSWLIS